MEVKPGYKQTEVGVIPKDWEIKTLGNVFTLKNGFAFSSDYFSKSGPIVLTPGNFSLEGGLYFEKQNTKRYSGPYSSAMTFCKGDLLIVMTDLTPQCNLLGKPAFVETDELVLHNQRVGKIELKDKSVDPRMLFYLLLSRRYLGKIKEQATGSTVRHTSNKSIYSVQLAWPSLREQSAIADALSDVDALLDGLDRVVAKKRDLKEAAMQQLITNRARRSETKAKWAVTVLESLCRSFTKQTGFDYSASIKQSLTFENRRDSLPFIQNKDFSGCETNYQTDCFIPERVAVNFPRILLDERCFLISISGRVGNVGVFSNKRRAFVGGAIAVAKFRDTRHLDWVMYYLQSREGQDKLLANVKAGSHQNLILNDLRKIEIPLPSPKEREEITSILSDIDREIAVLQQRGEKTRALKQAMMQELLTGKTRLI